MKKGVVEINVQTPTVLCIVVLGNFGQTYGSTAQRDLCFAATSHVVNVDDEELMCRINYSVSYAADDAADAEQRQTHAGEDQCALFARQGSS